MLFPSFSTVIVSLFLLYMSYSTWSLVELTISELKCSGEPCFESYLNTNPKLRLMLYTSSPYGLGIDFIEDIRGFDHRKEFQKDYNVSSGMTTINGSMFLHVLVGADDGLEEWTMMDFEYSTMFPVMLTEYAIPGIDTCKPLDETNNDRQESSNEQRKELKPVTHFYQKIHVSMLTEDFSVTREDVPHELRKYVRINKDNLVLPILQVNFFKIRFSDLVEVTPDTTTLPLSFNYSPMELGMLRFIIQFQDTVKASGYEHLNLDGVKDVLSNKSIFLLCLGSVLFQAHILFDILAFRNDILFWRRTNTFAGLSVRTTLLRAFGQSIIFLYLLDESAFLLLLFPAGFAAAIEIWKCKRIFKIEFTICGIRRRKEERSYKIAKAEKETADLDKEAMRYLSYLLCPLFAAGVIYSLVYPQHKSWYPWALTSLANGVYTFGFLFMFPQLFINYKLKSVAALPWRPLVFRALNTFIDDMYTFTLSAVFLKMTCFRDDIMLIIFLYQRWLYPIKETPVESDNETDGDTDTTEEEGITEKKHN